MPSKSTFIIRVENILWSMAFSIFFAAEATVPARILVPAIFWLLYSLVHFCRMFCRMISAVS